MTGTQARGVKPRVEPPIVDHVAFDGLTQFWDFDSRRGRCFELTAHALAFGSAPDDALLIHGSWHGPGAKQRIRHSILVLKGGRVWEPTRARLYSDFNEFAWWADWEIEHAYGKDRLMTMLAGSGHYGPWTESEWP